MPSVSPKEALRQAIDDLDLTQEEIAHAIGVSRGALNRYLNENRVLNTDSRERLHATFGIDRALLDLPPLDWLEQTVEDQINDLWRAFYAGDSSYLARRLPSVRARLRSRSRTATQGIAFAYQSTAVFSRDAGDRGAAREDIEVALTLARDLKLVDMRAAALSRQARALADRLDHPLIGDDPAILARMAQAGAREVLALVPNCREELSAVITVTAAKVLARTGAPLTETGPALERARRIARKYAPMRDILGMSLNEPGTIHGATDVVLLHARHAPGVEPMRLIRAIEELDALLNSRDMPPGFDRWLLGIAITRVGLLAVSGQHERALHAAKDLDVRLRLIGSRSLRVRLIDMLAPIPNSGPIGALKIRVLEVLRSGEHA